MDTTQGVILGVFVGYVLLKVVDVVADRIEGYLEKRRQR